MDRVVELVKPQQPLVAFEGRHTLHYAAGRYRQGAQARIGQQQLARSSIEIGDAAITLAHHGSQRVVVEEHALDIALENLRMA